MALKDWKRQLEALEKNEIPEFLKAKDLGSLLKKERHEEIH